MTQRRHPSRSSARSHPPPYTWRRYSWLRLSVPRSGAASAAPVPRLAQSSLHLQLVRAGLNLSVSQTESLMVRLDPGASALEHEPQALNTCVTRKGQAGSAYLGRAVSEATPSVLANAITAIRSPARLRR